MPIDYRTLPVSEFVSMFKSRKEREQKRTEMINAALKAAVWHSIKDGQITPALSILGSVSEKSHDRELWSLYLTRYGNMAVGKNGLTSSKEKNKVRYGLEKANEVYETLPDLEEAFPRKEKEWKDVNAKQLMQSMFKNMASVRKHGAKVIANETEQYILNLMQDYLNGIEIEIESEETTFTEEDQEELMQFLKAA